MSAGGMHCRTSSTAGVLPYAGGPEVRQGAQMRLCLQSFWPLHELSYLLLLSSVPFFHSPNPHGRKLFTPTSAFHFHETSHNAHSRISLSH